MTTLCSGPLACCFAHFVSLRSAEFTISPVSYSSVSNLSVAGISVNLADFPSCIRVNIKASKTFSQKGATYSQDNTTPPFCAMDALFISLSDSWGLSSSTLPFPFCYSAYTLAWRSRLGLGNCASHSLQSGAAKVSGRPEFGVPDHLIQTLGHWSSNDRSYVWSVQRLSSHQLPLNCAAKTNYYYPCAVVLI